MPTAIDALAEWGEPAVLDTDAGPVNYWVGPLEKEWAESYTERAGGNTKVAIRVAWDDAADFFANALGYATRLGSGSYIPRRLPLQLPWANDQYLEELNSLRPIGTVEEDPILPIPQFGRAEFAEYEAVFRPRWYAVREDIDVSAKAVPELYRYVNVYPKVVGRERRLNNALLYKDGDMSKTPIPDVVGFAPWVESAIVYEWLMVPLRAVPLAAIKARLNTINATTFDAAAAEVGFERQGGPHDAKTLLFAGVEGFDKPYKMPGGKGWAVDLKYLFKSNPETWEKVFIPGSGVGTAGAWQKVLWISNDGPLYATSDFDQLFIPA